MREGVSDTSRAVEINQLTKVFSSPTGLLKKLYRTTKTRVIALKDVNLTVNEGEIFGLVGRNGAGKTTLIKSISTLIEPTSGQIRVFGYDTVKQSGEVKARVGLVTSDDRSFYGRLTGEQNLMFFARLHGIDDNQARRSIKVLTELLELEEQKGKRFHEFSTGNKQRLAIARALLTDPPLILLDEPTRSLDPIAASDLRRMIRERMSRGKTIIITTHNLPEAEELCGRVAILSRGEIKECATLDELRAKYGSHERVVLQIRQPLTHDGLGSLAARISTLQYREVADRTVEVEFTRQSGDQLLHEVFSSLLASGAEIVNCQTCHVGLKEIMERIEGDDTKATNSANS